MFNLVMGNVCLWPALERASFGICYADDQKGFHAEEAVLELGWVKFA